MTELANKALKILQSLPEKPEYFTFDLTSKGFSEAEATSAIKELEENNRISVTKEFINGNAGFVLL